MWTQKPKRNPGSVPSYTRPLPVKGKPGFDTGRPMPNKKRPANFPKWAGGKLDKKGMRYRPVRTNRRIPKYKKATRTAAAEASLARTMNNVRQRMIQRRK